MNKPITRLFWLIVVLFGVLVYFTSKSTVFDAQALRDNALNKHEVFAQQKIHRGRILASDDSVLARSVPAGGGRWTRLYPPSSLFSQTVGYSYTTLGRAGLERYYNNQLTGQRGEFHSILDQLSGTKPKGDDLLTGLNPEAQQVALDGLAGRKGAVVALDPRTGQVQVMASYPGYNENLMGGGKSSAALNTDPDAPLVNRVTQGTYPPGSTFKVVTSIAAIDSGKYTPDTIVNGDSPKKISGVPLANDDNESYGDITLGKALTNSVNTVFARVALKVGGATMQKYMSRLGFGKDIPLDFPHDQIAPSGIYAGPHGSLVDATDGDVDLGRMGIGQEKLLATPLQMAQVAASVANGGKLMKPHLGNKVIDPDGRVTETVDPEQESTVMSAKSAREVAQMMSNVVNDEGTGTAAQIPGVEVAGKTGTAQIDIENGITQPWFIAFAPVNHPRVAIAVTVERTEGGFGGTVAAPIAKNVMETLLR
jgi:peptidoglycan glycosyltransferase